MVDVEVGGSAVEVKGYAEGGIASVAVAAFEGAVFDDGYDGDEDVGGNYRSGWNSALDETSRKLASRSMDGRRGDLLLCSMFLEDGRFKRFLLRDEGCECDSLLGLKSEDCCTCRVGLFLSFVLGHGGGR